MIVKLAGTERTERARNPGKALCCALIAAMATAAASADEGVLEINQACAEVGCFAGDGAGFPVVIHQPGSYRLTSSLLPGGATGIQLAAGTRIVDIDLNGFRIDGGGSGQGGGIVGASGASAITIRNGTIVSMGGDGIDVGGSAVVESVHVLANTGDGIDVNQTSLVRDSRVVGNGGYGIRFSDASALYSGNVFSSNGSGSVLNGRTAGRNVCDDGRCGDPGTRVWVASWAGSQSLGFEVYRYHLLNPSDANLDVHKVILSGANGALLEQSVTPIASGGFADLFQSTTNLPVGWPDAGTVIFLASEPFLIDGHGRSDRTAIYDYAWSANVPFHPIDCETQKESYALICGYADLLAP